MQSRCGETGSSSCRHLKLLRPSFLPRVRTVDFNKCPLMNCGITVALKRDENQKRNVLISSSSLSNL